MGQPAARITDMHTCPMVTVLVPHVGGPVTAPCCPTVIIGGLPAARVGDLCICVGPPDVIVQGSATVFIGGMPAARLGDMTSHGGVITTGMPTVLIGDQPNSGNAASLELERPGNASTNQHTQNDPEETADVFGKSIKIGGSVNFRKKVLDCLAQIKKTPSGARMLADLEATGKTVTILPTRGGNKCKCNKAGAENRNVGSDSEVLFNADEEWLGGLEDWETRPPGIGLAHELIHATHNARGERDVTEVDNDSQIDEKTNKTVQTKKEEVRTVGIEPYESEPYSENKIRSEWDPPQPKRTYY